MKFDREKCDVNKGAGTWEGERDCCRKGTKNCQYFSACTPCFLPLATASILFRGGSGRERENIEADAGNLNVRSVNEGPRSSKKIHHFFRARVYISHVRSLSVSSLSSRRVCTRDFLYHAGREGECHSSGEKCDRPW